MEESYRVVVTTERGHTYFTVYWTNKYGKEIPLYNKLSGAGMKDFVYGICEANETEYNMKK